MGKALSKFYIMTFGCKMNTHDSERMSAKLLDAGLVPAKDIDDTDVLILNTCSVREKPEDKIGYLLTNYKNFKRHHRNRIVAIAGCVAQQKGQDIIKQFPFVDIVLGPDCEDSLLEHINNVLAKREGNVVDTLFTEGFSYSETLYTDESIRRSDASVVAMKGCNSYCSYCIVPYVRGRECSRSLEDIVADVRKMTSSGISSVTLLGQNMSRYGFDNNSSLYELLHKVSKVEGLKRLSFLTSHPKDFTFDLIRAFKEIKNLSPMLHLPAQHGSDKMLKAMNRGYTRAQYMAIIDQLRKEGLMDKLAVSTDIIVGFPGETDSDFDDLMSLLKEVQFDNSFSFIYSPRPGTVAYKQYGATIKEEDRKIYIERYTRYHDLQREVSFERNKKLEGSVLEVLIEGSSDKDPNKLTGRTAGWKVVNFEVPEVLSGKTQMISPGKYLMVKIKKAHPSHLTGEVLYDK